MIADMMDRARKLLSEAYGYSAFRGQQHDVIEAALAGRDCLVLMPTGGGKSLCYQLPSLLRDGTGIVISPLIALMRDQVTALTQIGIRAAYLNSSLGWHAQEQVLDDVAAGALDLVYVAPERLLQPRTLERLQRTADLADRHRRSALRLAMGSRLPPGLPRARRAARSTSPAYREWH